MLDSKGRRIRSFCIQCGAPIFNLGSPRCRKCYFANRAADAKANAEQINKNKKQSRLNWYYNNKDHATQKHKDWLEANKDKVKEYEQEHIEERRAYVETRRARILEADEGFTARDWKEMLKLYNYTCAYCMKQFKHLEQDHVIPLSRNGKHSWDNVVPACLPCNRSKARGSRKVAHPLFEVIRLSPRDRLIFLGQQTARVLASKE